MNLYRVLCAFSVLSLVALGAGPATADDGESGGTMHAQAKGFYFGGQGGYGFHDADARDLFDAERESGVDISRDDLRDVAWGGFAGLRFHDHMAVEVGWLDVGEYSGTRSTGEFIENRTADTDGLRVRAIGFVPVPFINKKGDSLFEAMFGMGMYIFDTQGSRSCSNPTEPGVAGCPATDPSPGGGEPEAFQPANDSGQAFNLSAGMQFNIHEGISARVEYDRMFNMAGIDSDIVTASILFNLDWVKGLVGLGGD